MRYYTILLSFLLRALLCYDLIYSGACISSQSQIVAPSPGLTPEAALALLARGREGGGKAHSEIFRKTEAVQKNNQRTVL